MQHEEKHPDQADFSWRSLQTTTGIPFHVCCATGRFSTDTPEELPAVRGGMFCDDPVSLQAALAVQTLAHHITAIELSLSQMRCGSLEVDPRIWEVLGIMSNVPQH